MTPEELANKIERLSYGWTIHYGWPESIKAEVVRMLRQDKHAARLEGIRLAVLYYDPDLTEKGVQGEVADIMARLEKGENG